jgi:hypothetical protein
MTRWIGDSKMSSGQEVLKGREVLREGRERIRGSILKFTQDTG